jgi:four helix bundle protein
MATFHSFEELDCWKEAVVLRRQVRTRTKHFPPDEKHRLIDQLVRATRSVTANIAEGFGRYHYQENTKFCRDSRGSLFEVLYHLIVAQDEGYLTRSDFEDLKLQVNKCIGKLNGYINYLQEAKRIEENKKSASKRALKEAEISAK